MKKMSVRILTAALIICSVICANVFTPFTKVNAGGASDEFKLHVIECSNDGLAVLIDINDKYVLVDGGNDKKIVANYLDRNCKKKNGKVVLESIILTHNHNDHINGILTILNDTSRFKVKQIFMEDIYNSRGDFKDELKNAIQRQRKVYGANVPDAIHMVKYAGNDAKGNDLYKPVSGFRSADVNNVSIKVYPPVDGFVNSTKVDPHSLSSTHDRGYRMNEASLIVKVTGRSGSALILGDALDYGFYGLCDKYGNQLNSDFCILAHHGLRSTNVTSQRYDKLSEVDLYNRYVKSKHYVFAASEGQYKADNVKEEEREAKRKKYKENWQRFVENLKDEDDKDNKVEKYSTKKSGTIHYNSATGNVNTNR